MNSSYCLSDLRKQRDELQLELGKVIKPREIQAAIIRGVIPFIEQYTKTRRKLGYLNRIPQELGKYADSLEGLIRSEHLEIGSTLDRPQEWMDDKFYRFLARWPKVHLENCNMRSGFYNTIEKYVLYQPNIQTLVKKWMQFIYKYTSLKDTPQGDFLNRFFRKRFKKTLWTLETITYTRFLAIFLKGDSKFYETVKTQLKTECRRYRDVIETQIGESFMVIPDVEECNPSVADFISDVALLRNVKQGESKEADEILVKMNNLGKKIAELEAQEDEEQKDEKHTVSN